MNLEKIIAVRTSKTIFKDGDKVIKMFDKYYKKADVLNEALNQARIEETTLSIPIVFNLTKFNDNWAIISEYIKGETLDKLMMKYPEKEDEYLELFLNLQLKVHETKSPMLNKLKDKMDRKIEMTNLNATTRYDLRLRLESMPKHSKLCHGDFNPSNIIITKEGTPYIIDWSHVTQGNATADVARTFLLFNLDGKTDLAKKYLNLYCEKTGKEIKYVQKWLPILAASQSVKGYEKEREILLSWVNKVDYE